MAPRGLQVAAALLGLALFSAALWGGVTTGPVPAGKKYLPPLQKTDYVNLKEYIPSLVIDLAYYSDKNFTGKRLYRDPEAYLRKGTADKLKKAAEEVAPKGYRLKIWDAYRPPSVQYEMWKARPNPRYLIDPTQGFSDHSRGCAVDLTMVDGEGREMEMPSPIDDFSPKADRYYGDVSPEQGKNARYLEEVMVRSGFLSIRTEWWHFADSERDSYGVTLEPPEPADGRIIKMPPG